MQEKENTEVIQKNYDQAPEAEWKSAMSSHIMYVGEKSHRTCLREGNVLE